ncbi:MAG: glucokinase [Pseudomonadota bacterium]
MAILVIDIGGTNTRCALFEPATNRLASLKKYRNHDHTDFWDILTTYLETIEVQPDALCLDLAGPVANGAARLTNIDWTITEDALRERTGIQQVKIINDLVAMGLSLQHLPDHGLRTLRAGDIAPFDNGQSLVINLGTGFNICPVKDIPKPIAMAVEAGHAATPFDILHAMQDYMPAEKAAAFDTVEKCFAGRRLASLHAALGHQGDDAAQIVDAAMGGNADAAQTLRLFQKMLGLYVGSMALNHLPQRGIYFAGSVARGALSFEAAEHFFEALSKERLFQDRIDAMPIHIMTLDEAPLLGSAEMAQQLFDL